MKLPLACSRTCRAQHTATRPKDKQLLSRCICKIRKVYGANVGLPRPTWWIQCIVAPLPWPKKNTKQHIHSIWTFALRATGNSQLSYTGALQCVRASCNNFLRRKTKPHVSTLQKEMMPYGFTHMYSGNAHNCKVDQHQRAKFVSRIHCVAPEMLTY